MLLYLRYLLSLLLKVFCFFIGGDAQEHLNKIHLFHPILSKIGQIAIFSYITQQPLQFCLLYFLNIIKDSSRILGSLDSLLHPISQLIARNRDRIFLRYSDFLLLPKYKYNIESLFVLVLRFLYAKRNPKILCKIKLSS